MDHADPRMSRRKRILVIAAGAIMLIAMLFFVPLATIFSFGVLLICPLLMVGMHKGGDGA